MDAVTHIPPQAPTRSSVPNPGPRPDVYRLPPDPLEPARRAGAAFAPARGRGAAAGISFTVSPLNPEQSFVSTLQLLNAGGILATGVAFGILGLIVRGGGRIPAVLAMIVVALACRVT